MSARQGLWRFGARAWRFSAVGVGNALVDLGTLNLLLWLLPAGGSLRIAAYNGVALLLANANSYLWNTLWTFGDKARGDARQRVLFAGQVVVNVAINRGCSGWRYTSYSATQASLRPSRETWRSWYPQSWPLPLASSSSGTWCSPGSDGEHPKLLRRKPWRAKEGRSVKHSSANFPGAGGYSPAKARRRRVRRLVRSRVAHVDSPWAMPEESMPLFGRKHGKIENAATNREAGAGRDPEHGAEHEPERDRLRQQLDEERRQRLEDVHKERAERLAAQQEQRRLQKENSHLTRNAQDLRLRLETERARARRKRFFGALFADKDEEISDDR